MTDLPATAAYNAEVKAQLASGPIYYVPVETADAMRDELLEKVRLLGVCHEAALARQDEAEARVAELERAATGLVNKLRQVHDSATYQGVWTLAQLHNGPYRGPQYDEELAALASVLAAHPDAEEVSKSVLRRKALQHPDAEEKP